MSAKTVHGPYDARCVGLFVEFGGTRIKPLAQCDECQRRTVPPAEGHPWQRWFTPSAPCLTSDGHCVERVPPVNAAPN